MININGKDWNELGASDIITMLSEQDLEESFYFEFKDDKVATKKVAEEISAFANTFGGYVILGVSDKKSIEGCTIWNEQRIHTMIHDAITPTPSFDVKRFTCNGSVVYVIRIDEGSEPPYITSSGKIFERLSSGSFVIKDSVRLSQIYAKRESLLAKMEKKISIPAFAEKITNVYGYIDSGFVFISKDSQKVLDAFNKADLNSIAKKLATGTEVENLTYVGNSILYVPGGLSSKEGHLPAHANNFLEIMADGSARMRILLWNNDNENSEVNMVYASSLMKKYKDVYRSVMGDLLASTMAYAKKYEALTTLRQFHPIVIIDDVLLEVRPDLHDHGQKLLDALKKHRMVMGIDTVVTDDRIPKTGLYTIDRRNMANWGIEYTPDTILDELFFSRFTTLGAVIPENDPEVVSDE